MIETKVCKGPCGLTKIASQEHFYKAAGNLDGLSGKCKACCQEHVREKNNDIRYRKKHSFDVNNYNSIDEIYC